MGEFKAVRPLKQFEQHNKNKGMTLIEVLVAVLVLGVGVMGFAALQLKSVKVTEETYSRSQAMSIAQDLIERVQVNAEVIAEYSAEASWSGENAAVTKTCRATTISQAETPCTASEMAKADIHETRLIASSMLEQGRVQLLPCSDKYCITVAWAKTALGDCDQTDFSEGLRGDKAHCVVIDFNPAI